MSDQQHMTAEPLVTHRLLMHLGNERAGRVEIEQIARLRVGRHRFRHAVGRKHHRRVAMVGRYFVEFLDEHGAELLKTLDHVAVVHDLVPHIDRGAVFLQRQNHDLDRAIDARAKAARLAKPDCERWLDRLG